MIGTRSRAALVLAASTVLGGLLGRVLVDGIAAPSASRTGAVVQMCSIALLAALAWAWLTVVAGVVDAWRWAGDRAIGSGRTPRGLRRWVLAASGVALTSALSGALVGPAAHATPGSPPVPAAAGTTGQGTVVVTDAAATTITPAGTTTVQPGDCLWTIAAAKLQPGAGPATIAARWRAIYRANRGVVGPDPDLIRPGQRLRLPR